MQSRVRLVTNWAMLATPRPWLLLVPLAGTAAFYRMFLAADVLRLAKRSNILHSTAIKVVIVIGVFALINAVVIIVHHLVQKAKQSTSSYRSVDHVVSPY